MQRLGGEAAAAAGPPLTPPLPPQTPAAAARRDARLRRLAADLCDLPQRSAAALPGQLRGFIDANGTAFWVTANAALAARRAAACRPGAPSGAVAELEAIGDLLDDVTSCEEWREAGSEAPPYPDIATARAAFAAYVYVFGSAGSAVYLLALADKHRVHPADILDDPHCMAHAHRATCGSTLAPAATPLEAAAAILAPLADYSAQAGSARCGPDDVHPPSTAQLVWSALAHGVAHIEASWRPWRPLVAEAEAGADAGAGIRSSGRASSGGGSSSQVSTDVRNPALETAAWRSLQSLSALACAGSAEVAAAEAWRESPEPRRPGLEPPPRRPARQAAELAALLHWLAGVTDDAAASFGGVGLLDSYLGMVTSMLPPLDADAVAAWAAGGEASSPVRSHSPAPAMAARLRTWDEVSRDPFVLLLELLACGCRAASDLAASGQPAPSPAALLDAFVPLVLARAAAQAYSCALVAGGGSLSGGARDGCAEEVAAQVLPLLHRACLLRALLRQEQLDDALLHGYAAAAAPGGLVEAAEAALGALDMPPLPLLLAAVNGSDGAFLAPLSQQLHTSAAVAGNALSRLVAVRPSFLPLPRTYHDLYLQLAKRPCSRCGGQPTSASLCLLTGRLLCSW